jgi:ATP-binding protein involved in chromosome partitioning
MAAPEVPAVTPAVVLEALRRIKGPDLESNIVELGLVSDVLIKDGKAYFSITIDPNRAAELEPLRRAAESVVGEVAGIKSVNAVLTAEKTKGSAAAPRAAGPTPGGAQTPEHPRVAAARAAGATGDGAKPTAAAAPKGPAPSLAPPPSKSAAAVDGVKHLIAVASGKGGVGKSTTALNLALGFQAMGLKVGILDADIYGPSQPRLLGLSGRPELVGGKTLKPMEAYGLKAMSIGFLIDESSPVIWRGPMVVGALNQMLRDVAWGTGGDLDVLVVDMPPGTGDIQLSMAQNVPLSGAVIVSTPQDLALIDARKGLNMFRQVNVPVLGIVENMSYFLCPKCGERADIFGHGGARDEAAKLNLPFLGAIPLHIDVRATSDAGTPITATAPESLHAGLYRDLAAKTWAEMLAAKGQRIDPPELDLREGGKTLAVKFPNSASGGKGTSFELSAEMLRVMSPSAEVQGHSPDQRVTVGRKRNVKIKDLQPVGTYAIRIVFDDGHSTGLYAWNYLQLLHTEKDTRWAEYERELAAKGLNRG